VEHLLEEISPELLGDYESLLQLQMAAIEQQLYVAARCINRITEQRVPKAHEYERENCLNGLYTGLIKSALAQTDPNKQSILTNMLIGPIHMTHLMLEQERITQEDAKWVVLQIDILLQKYSKAHPGFELPEPTTQLYRGLHERVSNQF
ncbi:hypothetical protein DRJ48_03725, partial [Candidatus Woesearchaeota archaeon]